MGSSRAHGDGRATRAAHPLVAGGALAVVDVAAQALVTLLPEAASWRTSRRRPAARPVRSSPRGGPAASSRSSARPRAPRGSPRTSPRPAGGRRPSSSGRTPGRRPSRANASTRSSSTRRARAPGPCARIPEIRLRLAAGRSRRLRADAAAARSTSALDLLAPGGTLLYVTCSLEPEENEDVVDAAARRPARVRARRPPTRQRAGPLAAARTRPDLVRVLPGATHDGFTALLRDAPASLTSRGPRA